jgi:hypothetical protein
MYLKSYIQQELQFARTQLDGILKGLTDEEFLWMPPGKANPISAILIHMLTAEDDIIQASIRHRPALWEEQMWDRKIWIKTPPAPGRGWEEVRLSKLDLRPILEYRQVVYRATDDYLRTVTVAEMKRKVIFFGAESPVAEILVILINHNVLHAGEIAALKGIQGEQGLPG